MTFRIKMVCTFSSSPSLVTGRKLPAASQTPIYDFYEVQLPTTNYQLNTKLGINMLSLIVCFSKNHVIGCAGKLPWHYNEDLEHFKNITMGHTLIMGRKTYENLPNKLAGRKIIVVTNQKGFKNENCLVAHSLTQAIKIAGKTDNSLFICGGEQIYKEALPLVQKMYITEINKEYEGDAFFPEFNEKEWVETKRKTSGELTFRVLKKIRH